MAIKTVENNVFLSRSKNHIERMFFSVQQKCLAILEMSGSCEFEIQCYDNMT